MGLGTTSRSLERQTPAESVPDGLRGSRPRLAASGAYHLVQRGWAHLDPADVESQATYDAFVRSLQEAP